MALDVAGWVLGVLLFLAGLYVLGRAVLADHSRGRRRCPRCWYDMGGVTGLRCPECGREARSAAALLRTRRHRKRAAAGLLLLALGCLASVAPRLVRDPWGTLPTPVLSVVLWFYDDPSDTIFTTMTAALNAGKTTAFERLMMARYCARRLGDPNGARQAQLLAVVERLGPEARPAIPGVIRLSRGSPMDWFALKALVTLWPGTPALRSRVAECLDESPARAETILALIASGPRPMDGLIGPILESVRRAEPTTGALGARTLATLGPAATPALRELVSHRSEAVRSAVIAELGNRRDGAAVPGIAAALGDDSWWVRTGAVVALHKIGAAARPALPELVRLTREEPRITVRMQALLSLVPIGGDDAVVVDGLAEALQDQAPEVRRAAASELASLGPDAAAAEEVLEAATRDADESVALAAAAALEAVRKTP